MIKEFCAENFTGIPQAIQNGAKRIELCDNLAVGGTTPSVGVIEEAVQYAHEHQATVMTMIRPRGGNFVYSDQELKIMQTDLIEAKNRETDGVVFGCLTEDNWLDEEAIETLVDWADGLQVTFHMAFDEIPAERQFEAIDFLADYGVQRILTHGGAAGTSIEDNFDRLRELIAYGGDRIIILPGGGITAANVEEVAHVLGVNEAHGTKIVGIF